jgi:hypothetical protein
MEPIVHKSFGYILNLDAGLSLEWPKVDDTLMSNESRGATI